MVLQHVEHPDTGEGGGKELGSLGHAGTDEQAAVAPAIDRELAGRGVALCNQVFRRGDEIIEDILLVQLRPGTMPGFPVFAPPADVGDGKYTAQFHPGQARQRKAGGLADVKAPVPVEQGGVVPIQHEALAV